MINENSLIDLPDFDFVILNMNSHPNPWATDYYSLLEVNCLK
jgi:hypothetical protein